MLAIVLATALGLTNNVLIVDHLNINHQKGRQDLAKAFYFDVLGCRPDPRKAENLDAGKGTVWANTGISQFHLSEGKPNAQTLDGRVTLGYASLSGVRSRLAAGTPDVLADSAFDVLGDAGTSVTLRDPWGSIFELVEADDVEDARGSQPSGADAEPRAMIDLEISVPASAGAAGLAGIGRFYEQILGMPVFSCDETRLVLATAGAPRADGTPRQSLTFALAPSGRAVAHDESDVDEDGRPLDQTTSVTFLTGKHPQSSPSELVCDSRALATAGKK